MAKIIFINLLSRMTMATSHLMGTLAQAGHHSHTINFKRQQSLNDDEIASTPNFQSGDFSWKSYGIKDKDLYLYDTSGWYKIKPHEIQRLIQRIKELNPDAIGLTCLSHAMSLAKEVLSELRQHFDVPLLMGGVGSITEPDKAIEFCDLACTGEGEQVIVEIANRLDQKSGLADIIGTYYKQPDGQIQRNPKAKVSDLSALPMPIYDSSHYTFINGPHFVREAPHNYRMEEKSYTIMTQRGCPFSCSFCIESFLQNEFGKKEHLRRMPVERAINELKYAKDVLGHTSVAFWDDVFPINPEWLDEFLPRYKAEIGLPFFCYTYPSTTKLDVLLKIKDAGCDSMTMGVQSGSERILKDVFDRRSNNKQVLKAAKILVESGIKNTAIDLIPKTAFDREQDLIDTLELLLELPYELTPSFYNELAIYPNYPIHEKFKDETIISSSEKVSEELYLFYFKLMALTPIKRVDRNFIRQLINDPFYREDHNRLNEFLPSDEENVVDYNARRNLETQKTAQEKQPIAVV